MVDHVSKVLGGAEVNLIELLGHPGVRGGWEVAVACAPGSPLEGALMALGVPVLPHAFSSALNELRVVGRRLSPLGKLRGWMEVRRAAGRLAAHVAGFRPGVMLSCTNKDHFAAGEAARGRGVPSVWWVNDLLTADFFPWLVRKVFVRRARRLASRLVPVSRCGMRALVEEGVEASRVVPVWNGIPLERYVRDSGRPLRGRLGVGEGVPLVGILGRITPWKGQACFVDVAAMWKREGRPGRFAIIGRAFNEDAPFEQQLRARVAAEGLADLVSFVEHQPGVASTLSGLDVLLHCSTKPEPFGRVIIEAMAVGVPVIGARAGGVPEIITENADGLLATPGHVAEYVRGLAALVGDGGLRERLVRTALATVRQRFSLDRVVADFEAVLGTVTGNG